MADLPGTTTMSGQLPDAQGAVIEKKDAVATDPASLKKAIDDVLLDVLEDIGFHRNIWNFHPSQVRQLLRSLSYGMFLLSLFLFMYNVRKRYVFAIFGLVLYALYWYWYAKIECGGGTYIFSPDWRDSFIRTRATATNIVLDICVGYELDLQASLPLSSVAQHVDGGVIDEDWLGDEIEEQFHQVWK